MEPITVFSQEKSLGKWNFNKERLGMVYLAKWDQITKLWLQLYCSNNFILWPKIIKVPTKDGKFKPMLICHEMSRFTLMILI